MPFGVPEQGRLGGDPARLLQTAAGWQLFKTFLLTHHTSEDDVLWPALRTAAAGHPDQLALADALEEEHSVIDPLLAAIGAAGADPDHGHEAFGGLVDELITKLSAHLTHEENDGLPLIDAVLPEADWQRFSNTNGQRNRPYVQTFLPWLLSEASPQARDAIIGTLPPQVLTPSASSGSRTTSPATCGKDCDRPRQQIRSCQHATRPAQIPDE